MRFFLLIVSIVMGGVLMAIKDPPYSGVFVWNSEENTTLVHSVVHTFYAMYSMGSILV